MFDLPTGLSFLLLLCIVIVCLFEFINGFHDTANAVATVIYTNTLKPWHAVIWSGLWNFLGVLAGGVAVAMGIANLLPVDVLMEQGIAHNVAMVMAILVAAIAWNLGTWYFGIPCSSSHTLIGSILGVGIVFARLPENVTGIGVNWQKAIDIGMSLLISPLFGFSVAIMLMFILRTIIQNKEIFKEPNPEGTPPTWIRAILIATCTGVSFAHGSNDGQKGVGLMLIILMTFLPLQFALNPKFDALAASAAVNNIEQIVQKNAQKGSIAPAELSKAGEAIASLKQDISTFDKDNSKSKFAIRKRIQLLDKKMKVFLEFPGLISESADRKQIKDNLGQLKTYTDFAPYWIVVVIALSLGLGTMFGWKRIVVTIGEKIGKRHMTYAEGATAELVAASTIGLSTYYGLPVSTTQVLSSGVAGGMVASKGVKNLQAATIQNIALAWILTLPVTIALSGGLYLLFRAFI
ncbi:MAG: inorganic phosphate transporter [Sphingobacteriales bacterium]|nr:inorganic phosphate transporter [Sphingobacteriales bacterium]MCC7223539.1 inorganic phosphate transporter [Chitinophagales bacterium]TXI82109.1 MAG: inorganic phosphate transporter [Crocinitomicaceae bacterium]